MNRQSIISAVGLVVFTAWGFSDPSTLVAQPAPPAFPHLQPIHADGSPAERVLPIQTKVPPVEPAPPSMGYYETRWRRWSDVVMPRLPEKGRPRTRVPERVAPPAEELNGRDNGGESLPPLNLPPLLPGNTLPTPRNGGGSGIPFLPGDQGTTPPAGGVPTPAGPQDPDPVPTDLDDDLQDLFRDPVPDGGNDAGTDAVPDTDLQPPKFEFGDPADDERPVPPKDLLDQSDPFKDDPPADLPKDQPMEKPEATPDNDLDDLFRSGQQHQETPLPVHLRTPARTVSAQSMITGEPLLQPASGPLDAPVATEPAAVPRRLPAAAEALRVPAVHDGAANQSQDGNPLRGNGWKSPTVTRKASFESAPLRQTTNNPLR